MYPDQSYWQKYYPGLDVTNVTMDPSIYPGVGSVAPTFSDALGPSQQAFNFQSRAPFAPFASLGSNPPGYSGYVPYTAEGGPGEGSFQSGSGAAKPWEASDKELMLGMMASNMFPTRDQPRIMGDSGGSGGGMAKGAIQGAMIGSKFGSPWWGAAIGGGLGALGMFDTTTPPKIVPAEIKRGQRTAFPQVPPMASYYPGLLNA
jgi:hypothetical protein